MKKYYIFTAMLLVLAVTVPVAALDITDNQAKTRVVHNCTDAQRSMQSIQRSDAVSRVNRGNTYDNLSKLMTALSSRAALNAYSVPALTDSTNAFRDLREHFIKDYTEYEMAVREAIAIKCTERPEDFYGLLETSRARRGVIAERIKSIDTQFELFAKAADTLDQQIKARQ